VYLFIYLTFISARLTNYNVQRRPGKRQRLLKEAGMGAKKKKKKKKKSNQKFKNIP